MLIKIRRILVVAALASSVIACGTLAGTPTSEGTRVLVRVVDDTVVLTPAVVPAGTVRFVIEENLDPASHSGFQFVSRGRATDIDQPPPLLDGDVERLRADSAPQGLGNDSGWGLGITLVLRPGEYAFMVPGPGGGAPGTPPASVTVLTVTE